MARSFWVKLGSLLALLGLLVAGYLWTQQLFAPSHWCILGERFNCSIVSQSQFGWMDGVAALVGIPFFHISNAVAVLPVFLFLGVGFFWFYRFPRWVGWLRLVSTASLVYAGLLLFLAIFVLGAVCIFCLTLDAILIGLVLAAWKLKI